MSRHDEALTRAQKYLNGEEAGATGAVVIYDLAVALRAEIKAHDVTRIDRNTGSQHVAQLLGNVRGLESKVSALQAELDSAKRTFFGHDGATSYREGYLAGLVAAKVAIEALEK